MVALCPVGGVSVVNLGWESNSDVLQEQPVFF